MLRMDSFDYDSIKAMTTVSRQICDAVRKDSGISRQLISGSRDAMQRSRKLIIESDEAIEKVRRYWGLSKSPRVPPRLRLPLS
jgi:hypothetical protein